jgi:tRNA threonylcarbamoyl adenosine modification protein YeaZ
MSRILAIDTATSRTVAALDGAGLSAASGHRHGRELLRLIDELVGGGPPTSEMRDLAGVVVGTGPGSFTGLRVGLATAKTLAHAFGLPIVGVPTSVALAVAASRDHPQLGGDGGTAQPIAVLQPAGPGDRYLTLVQIDSKTGEAELVEPPHILPPGSWEKALDAGTALVAVDLDDAADLPEAARALGRVALDGLARALLDLGGARLQRGVVDDVAELVPVYVTLPRGVQEAAASVAWSPELH